jgi:plasmid stabilization system protein ParE
MRVVLTAAATADLDLATRWYDNQVEGLAARFLDEYEALLTRLGDNPLQFPAIRGTTHRAGFRHFPYGLFFRLRDHQVGVNPGKGTKRDIGFEAMLGSGNTEKLEASRG